MTDIQVAATGFLLVTGTGLIALTIRRILVAGRITRRYKAARKVQGLYLETHTCTFTPCAAEQRETERQAAQDRLR